jgi:hypothetical protein
MVLRIRVNPEMLYVWIGVLFTHIDITVFRCVICPVLFSIILQYCMKVYEMVYILHVLGRG